MQSVTCSAPVNIAVIKYWGKRDEDLVLPVNSSVSVTLHQDQLKAKTTVAISKEFQEDKMWLNGREQSMQNPRVQNILREIKRRARKRKNDDNMIYDTKLNWKIHVCSENNFPTAAGLASSAAGYACLVYALAKLYDIKGDLSEIARRGSGSACRSVYGGFVVWNKGVQNDGSDSCARQIVPESHWPELRTLIIVVSDQEKQIGSSEGMGTTVKTSELLQHRIETVPSKVEKITKAILNKDFCTFAEITMKDSNQLHAVCLDTYPPISYMTDISRQIIQMVHNFNRHCEQIKVAYTFDAGPNACLYLLEEDVPRVFALIKCLFSPSEDNDCFVRGLPIAKYDLSKEDLEAINVQKYPDSVKFVLHTKPGPGPTVIDDSLLNDNGLPKSLSPCRASK